MFEPPNNPGYEKLAYDAAGLIGQWTRNDWYETSAEEIGSEEASSDAKTKAEEIEPEDTKIDDDEKGEKQVSQVQSV